MSRRRLERGYWNGRQVGITDKEHSRIYVLRQRGGGATGWYFRFGVTIQMDYPWPDEFRLDHRLPRKTRKALWKSCNGRPNWTLLGDEHMGQNTPALIHNGGKP